MKTLVLILDGCSVEKIIVRKFLASCSSFPEKKSWIFRWTTSTPSGLPSDASGWFQELKWVGAILPLLRLACPGHKSHLSISYCIIVGEINKSSLFSWGNFLGDSEQKIRLFCQSFIHVYTVFCGWAEQCWGSQLQIQDLLCSHKGPGRSQGSPAGVFASQIRG